MCCRTERRDYRRERLCELRDANNDPANATSNQYRMYFRKDFEDVFEFLPFCRFFHIKLRNWEERSRMSARTYT